MENDTKDYIVAEQNWFVIFTWDLPPIEDKDKNKQFAKQYRRIKNIINTIKDVTGFEEHRIAALLVKAQDFKHVILRHNIREICETTCNELTKHGFTCILFPE